MAEAVAQPPPQSLLHDISDRGLVQRLQHLGATLATGSAASRDDDWEERLEALQELDALAAQDLSQRSNILATLHQHIRVPLHDHIEDIRSSLSRAACAVVVSLASHCRSDESVRAAISEWFVAPLLNATTNATKAVGESAKQALHAIFCRDVVTSSGKAIPASVSPGAVHALLQGCSARHSTARYTAFAYLYHILLSVANSEEEPCALRDHLMRQGKAVARVLRRGLSDASGETRRYARLAYWALEIVDRASADELYNGVEKSVRRAIERERNGFFAWMKAKHEKHPAEECDRLAAEAVRRTHPSLAPGDGARRTVVDLLEHELPQPPTRRTPGNGQKGGLPKGHRRTLSSPAVGTHAAEGQAQPQARQAKAYRLNSPSNQQEASSSSNANLTSIHADGMSASAMLSSWTSPQRAGEGDALSLRTPSACGSRQLRNHSKRANEESIVSLSPPTSTVPSARKDDVGVRERRGPRSADVSALMERSRSQVVVTAMSTRKHSGVPATALTSPASLSTDEGWILSRDALRSTQWSDRISGLTRLSASVGQLPRHRLVEGAELVVPRLNDPHFRVTLAALECFEELIQAAPNAFSGVLQDLIVALLGNLTSTKKAVRDISHLHLKRVVGAYPLDQVVHALYRILDDVVTPKVKLSTLESLQFLYEENPEFTAMLSPMKLALNHLVLFITAGKISHELRKAAMALLASMYVVSSDSFVRAILQLPSTEMQPVVVLLADAIPHIAQECRRRLEGERQLEHPAVGVSSPFKDALGRINVARIDGVIRSIREQNRCHEFPIAALAATDLHESPYRRARYRASSSPSRLKSSSPKRQQEQKLAPSKEMEKAAGSRGPPEKPHKAVPLSPPSPEPPLARSVRVRGADTGGAFPIDWKMLLMSATTTAEKMHALDTALRELERVSCVWAEHFAEIMGNVAVLAQEASEPQHQVRARAIRLAQHVVRAPFARRLVSAALASFFTLARTALDDSFNEVRYEGAALLMELVVGTGSGSSHTMSPPPFGDELSLVALLTAAERYVTVQRQRYGERVCLATASKGWLELITEVGRSFDRMNARCASMRQSRVAIFCETRVPGMNQRPGAPGRPGTEVGVLHETVVRILKLLVYCLRHDVPEVRKTAVLVAVAMWTAIGDGLLPYLAVLTHSQKKLVSMYYNKTALQRYGESREPDGVSAHLLNHASKAATSLLAPHPS